MKILVTGASGFIGRRFCADAVAAGHEVLALARPRPEPAGSPPPGRLVYGQLPYDIPPWALAGLDAIVHGAGATTGQDWAEARAVTVEGTRALLRLSTAAGSTIKRFVFLSSQSAHEEATAAYGVTKREAEEVVRGAGVPHAIIRPGLVYGPGTQGLFARMRKSVSRLPALPLLGGGRAIVQAVEVGDLSAAMLACLALQPGDSPELNLGDPDGVTLADFLSEVALASTGRRKLRVSIPVGPILMVTTAAEAVGLKLPISSDNLRGLQKVRRMETRESLARLGMELKPLGEGIRAAIADQGPPARGDAPMRVLLIGAGKIGIVHALNLTRREGVSFCGMAEPSRGAAALYSGMGFRVPVFRDAAEAISSLKPDGAIIATPASTHYPLAKLCLSRGVGVLVEKPMAMTPALAADFRALAAGHPGAVCHTGYMAAQYPHLDAAAQALRSGELGRIIGVRALALQSHIMAAKPVRWEMRRSLSGGGVLINFAGHVMSMLHRLFGEPAGVAARQWSIHSTEVEDAADVQLNYGDFSARMLACWSIPGYSRPVYRITAVCERGRVVVDNAFTVIQAAGGEPRIMTQPDCDIGYNAAPDYTGGGFACEHRNFIAALRGAGAGDGAAPSGRPVTVEEAAAMEELIFRLYAGAPDFTPAAEPGLEDLDREMGELVGRMGR